MRPFRVVRYSFNDVAMWLSFLRDAKTVSLMCLVSVIAAVVFRFAREAATKWLRESLQLCFVLAVPRTRLLEYLKPTPFAAGGACAAEVRDVPQDSALSLLVTVIGVSITGTIIVAVAIHLSERLQQAFINHILRGKMAKV
jgi:hypothetical protein